MRYAHGQPPYLAQILQISPFCILYLLDCDSSSAEFAVSVGLPKNYFVRLLQMNLYKSQVPSPFTSFYEGRPVILLGYVVEHFDSAHPRHDPAGAVPGSSSPVFRKYPTSRAGTVSLLEGPILESGASVTADLFPLVRGGMDQIA